MQEAERRGRRQAADLRRARRGRLGCRAPWRRGDAPEEEPTVFDLQRGWARRGEELAAITWAALEDEPSWAWEGERLGCRARPIVRVRLDGLLSIGRAAAVVLPIGTKVSVQVLRVQRTLVDYGRRAEVEVELALA